MAATLTGAGELTYASFPIDKVETDADGDLIVYGKASDGSIDSDEQIVDPSWMARAAQAWKESGANLRVQHNPQRDPAGVGLEVETDATGATWVKGLIVEPIAKKLVAKGALRAYSVGIARPTIERDAMARGGRITSGELVEISLVDRPANKRCGIQLVKSAADGTPEYVNEVFGAEADIAKALDGDVTKAAPAGDDLVNVDLPKGASISISPADFAALRTFKQQLTVKTAGATIEAMEKHDADGPLDDSTSKGIVTETETDTDLAKADAPAEQETVTPDVTKDPAPEPAKKAKKPKKMPPWLKGDDDAKSGSDDGKDDDSSCKSVSDHLWTGIEGTSDIVCSKCHTTPAAAAGVTASPMQPAPVTELQESDGPACTKGATPASASGAVGESMKPAPAHREPDGAAAEAFEADAGMSDGDSTKAAAPDLAPDPEVAALLRFKAVGTPEDLGRLHDLTCPAYSPEMAAKYHPYADLRTLIDSGAWQRKTLAAAAGPLEGALKMQEMWQAALLLKTADPGDLNDWRAELHKAFRDANPGPGSYPTPGCVSPQRYNRPVLGDGRAANSVGYGMPNSSPQVATGTPDAHSFDRPPLSGAHQSPSPSHMKGDGQYPGEQGVPTQLTYAQMQKEHQRQALTRMHEHLSRQFPEACPMSLDGPQQPERKPVPPIAGIGKGDGGIVPGGPGDQASAPIAPAASSVPAAALKATPEQEADLFADAEVFKSFKKMRKKLGKKILSGKMTVDEARAHLGRQFAQKGTEAGPEVAKAASAVSSSLPGTEVVYNVSGGGFDPEVIKAAVREALHVETVPLEATEVRSFDPSPAIEAAVTKALAPFAEQVTNKLADQQKVIDAIADQPDPSTAAFSGLAFQPQVIKSRRPAAVPDQAEYAARAQQMIRRNLQNTYQTHSDPHVREAAGSALANLGVGAEAPPMT